MATPSGLRRLPRAFVQARSLHRPYNQGYATAAAAVEYPDTNGFVSDDAPLSPPLPIRRKRDISKAEPFSHFLTDTFNRQHDYLRISLTERCNLRCLYCMPEEGIELSPNRDLLTSAEIYYLSALFVNQGVNKIRLTGGEPTVRKDIVPLMQRIGTLRRDGLKELALTTNGISLHRKLDAMVEAGLTGVNISLDTLDPFQFQLLTRRQGFDAVMKSINRVQEMNKVGAKVKLKINAVVMRGLNDHQILPFVEKTRDEDIEVRFIEYMPFGGNKWSENKMLPFAEMVDIIRAQYPGLMRLKDAKNDTSKTYQIPGFKGRVGFITSMTHNFCGTCNRLRITSDGNLKVCLHGNTEVSLRDLLRSDHSGEPLDEAAFEAIRQVELDRRTTKSLRYDGEEGWVSKEQQLLEVIGAAVKRKKAKHAGMGQLENMKNRPMILIGEARKSPTTITQSVHSRQQRTHLCRAQTRPHLIAPFHLLPLPTSTPSHVRFSSDKASATTDEPTDQASATTTQEPPTKKDPGSFFNFQSLTELFSPAEPRRRYSRPDEYRNDKVASSKDGVEGVDVLSGGPRKPRPVQEHLLAAKEDNVEPSPPKGRQQRKVAQFQVGQAQKAKKANGTGLKEPMARVQRPKFVEPTSLDAAQHQQSGKTEASWEPFLGDNGGKITQAYEDQRAGLEVVQQAVPLHFAIGKRRPPRTTDGKSREDYGRHLGRNVEAASWRSRSSTKANGPSGYDTSNGVSRAAPVEWKADIDHGTDSPFHSTTNLTELDPKIKSHSVMDVRPRGGRKMPASRRVRLAKPLHLESGQILMPRATTEEPSKPWGVDAGDKQNIDSGNKSSDVRTEASVPTSESISNPAADPPLKQLTHLKSTGEAHMVDVGGKSTTKRVAIAIATVVFSNSTPLQLIQENNNKKGDVLGVARIAGILAAKKTPGLIPLCHPIAISKVEVEIEVVAKMEYGQRGGVRILAQVECTGPTGVEMEALASASIAAMTVVDMCKAVDRKMHIGNMRVVYKAGGKSGIHVWKPWANERTPAWFAERGLELPWETKKPGHGAQKD